MDILSFDVTGDYGHFRKYYTTSSPLTFSTIPPTAVYGLIGAILGLDKENNAYLGQVNANTTQVAVRVNQPVKKIRMGINHLDTKNSFWAPRKGKNKNPRTQIRTEFLKDVSYRIYVHMQDKQLFEQLSNMTQHHQSVYTTCLGLSELLADCKFHKFEQGMHRTQPKSITVSSVIPLSMIHSQEIEITPGMHILKEKQPIDMNENRVVKDYQDLIFDSHGKPITAKLKQYIELPESGENIVFCNERWVSIDEE